MQDSIRRIARNLTRRLPPRLHFALIQPFSQPQKFLRTVRYRAGLLANAGQSIAGIQLGSGNCRIEGFWNIDGNPLLTSDIIAGVEKLRLKSGSVRTIYASHVFEHIPRAEIKVVLAEWQRVLRPQGSLYICVPDVEALFRLYLEHLPAYDTANGRKIVDFACGVTYGGQVDRFDFHFYGYSLPTLTALLESVGFTNVQRFTGDDVAFALPADAHVAAIAGVSVSLNVRAEKC